jgi:hypothetical protein
MATIQKSPRPWHLKKKKSPWHIRIWIR